MVYKRAKTTARGLGHAHQVTRSQQVKVLAASPGRPCPKCGLPMFATPAEAATVYAARRVFMVRGRRVTGRQMWHVDLDDYPGRVFGGPQVKRLMHRHCNRRAGAVVGNRLRALQTPRRGYGRW